MLRYFRVADGRPVVIAASTLRGEDQAALEAFRRVQARWPEALLIIAPRHPERFDEVVRLAGRRGLPRASAGPSSSSTPRPTADVVVLDTIGELARLYQLATRRSSSAAASSTPAATTSSSRRCSASPSSSGRTCRNFAEIADEFLRGKAALQVHSTPELGETLVSLVGDAVRRASLGAAARALVESNRGAKARTLAVVDELLPARDPARRARRRAVPRRPR